MKSAHVTGITRQDGSYLAEHLVEHGHRVFGLVRRTSWRNPGVGRAAYLSDRVELLNGDLLDRSSLINAIAESRPDEIYNLAAQSPRRGPEFVTRKVTPRQRGSRLAS